MPLIALVVFAAPLNLVIALAILLCIIAVGYWRKVSIGLIAGGCFVAGAILLAGAAGLPTWNRTEKPAIVVMVDLSPSTRGATYRDRVALDSRLHPLLGDQPFQMLAFAERNQPMPAATSLADLSADQTIFAPPTADAVILLSDGQFELPAFAPPTYPVVDPALDHPADAAVVDLRQVDSDVLATVRDANPARPLKWTGATPGRSNLLAMPGGVSEITASFSAGDLWPENDSLTLSPAPPAQKQKWWIGDNPPAGWRAMSTAEAPSDSASFLQPAVVVLNDVAADALSSEQQLHLLQYVRDLGGSVVMVGGPRAFSAGHYENTPLEAMSPLASSPPQPTMQWMLLIDGSGSMAGDPWKTEVGAFTRLLPQLPAADAVSVGNFAESLTWWSSGRSAEQTAKLSLPPVNVGPGGPTNLAAAIEVIISKGDGSVPAQLLLMTDADAELPHPAELAAAMNSKKIHLHLLAIGEGKALPALRSIATATGGSVIQELDAQQWVNSATLLLRSALPDRYLHGTLKLSPAPPASISEWNQTWLKEHATALQSGDSVPTIARWRMGLGQAIAIAYPADATNVEKFATQIQQPPADPRFVVTWKTSSNFRVRVVAIDHDQFMNGLLIGLEMSRLGGQNTPPDLVQIPQTAPGEYELVMPSPRSSQLICVRNGNSVLKRFSLAGRYAPEFESIGNNLPNLKQLAQRTGGEVVPPGPVKQINFAGRKTQTSLAPEIALAGFLAIGAGMIWYRRKA